MEIKKHAGIFGLIGVYNSPMLLDSLDIMLDLIGNASYQDIQKLIVKQLDLPTDFFELKTGFAGEVLQKFSTYNMRLAIVGDFNQIKSKSLNDFIRESNRMGHIIFVEDKEEALIKLDKK